MNTDTVKSLICSVMLILSVTLQSQTVSEYKRIAEQETGEKQADAQNMLGIAYFEGSYGARKNEKKGLEWFEKAAAAGDARALYNLANCYRYGYAVRIDMDKAIELYKKAADRYYGDAAFVLGKWHYYGDTLPQDYGKAYEYLKIAAFNQYSKYRGKAFCLLAACHAKGYGVEKNYDKVLYLVERSLWSKVYEACNIAGEMFETGDMVERNVGRAVEYYRIAAVHENTYALRRLGQIYAEDESFGKNIYEAAAYLEKAAALGDTVSMRILAEKYSDRKSELYYYAKAVFWYRQLSYRGAEEDIYALMKLQKERWNPEEEMMLYIYMLHNANAEALNIISRMYAEGEYLRQDFRAAKSLIKKALEEDPGNPKYMNTLGEIYLLEGKEKRAGKIWKTILKADTGYYKTDGKESKLNAHMISGT